jgi:hypothetical protein
MFMGEDRGIINTMVDVVNLHWGPKYGVLVEMLFIIGLSTTDAWHAALDLHKYDLLWSTILCKGCDAMASQSYARMHTWVITSVEILREDQVT